MHPLEALLLIHALAIELFAAVWLLAGLILYPMKEATRISLAIAASVTLPLYGIALVAWDIRAEQLEAAAITEETA